MSYIIRKIPNRKLQNIFKVNLKLVEENFYNTYNTIKKSCKIENNQIENRKLNL